MRAREAKRHMVCLGLGVATALAARSLHASDDELARPLESAIAVEGDGSCFEAASMAEEVTVWLGRSQLDSRLRIVVRPDVPSMATVVVERDGAAIAERSFGPLPSECARARVALGLGIALAIDAAVTERVLGPAAVSPPPPADVTPPAHPDVARRAAPEREPVVVPFAAADGGLLAGALPDAVAVGAVGGGVLLGGQYAVQGTAFATSDADVHVGRGVAAASIAAARLDLCASRALAARRFTAVLCLGAAVGQLAARGRGFDEDVSARVGWYALGGQLGTEIALGRDVSLRVMAHGLAPLRRTELTVESREGVPVTSRAMPVLGGGGTVGVVFRFR